MTDRCDDCADGPEARMLALWALLAAAFVVYMLVRGAGILPVWITLPLVLAGGAIAGGSAVMALRLALHRRHHRSDGFATEGLQGRGRSDRGR